MRQYSLLALLVLAFADTLRFTSALSAVKFATRNAKPTSSAGDRRGFLMTTAAAVLTTAVVPPVMAAPEIFNTPKGAKYAVLQGAKEKARPANGDIVAIEYTGYLSDGTIFDATHAQGKKNALMFEVGGNAVIPGINEVVKELGVGEKVQAIIPPSLAFGEKGICLESGECLVKPGATLVYDIYLKRSAIPPP